MSIKFLSILLLILQVFKNGLLTKSLSSSLMFIHILVTCPSLSTKRKGLQDFFASYVMANSHLKSTVNAFLSSSDPSFQTQFLLDCSVVPEVIRLRQSYGCSILYGLFYLTRTWCYSLHRERLRQLGRWKPDFN